MKKKQHKLGFPFFKLPASTKNLLLNIILDDFRIWLLGYRTEFSCLYIPQGHYFISTVWQWSTDEYVIFRFWAKCRVERLILFALLKDISSINIVVFTKLDFHISFFLVHWTYTFKLEVIEDFPIVQWNLAWLNFLNYGNLSLMGTCL